MNKYAKYIKLFTDEAQKTLFEHVLYIDQNESKLLKILEENNISVEGVKNENI